jgi:hypothetical protein
LIRKRIFYAVAAMAMQAEKTDSASAVIDFEV